MKEFIKILKEIRAEKYPIGEREICLQCVTRIIKKVRAIDKLNNETS